MILSTQRSGSTMLCEDIKSLGVLGTPDEHLRLVLNQKKKTAAEQLVDFFTSNGNLNNSRFYSIKLMYNHLELLGYWISDRGLGTKTNKKKYREIALQFFLDKFDHVTFIYIQRKNKFEQALSYYRSAKTKLWHLRDGKKVENNHSISYKDQKLLKNIDINLFNRIYDKVCRRDRKLQRLIKNQGIHYLSFKYEDIRSDYPLYLLDIGAEAGIKLNINSLEERKIKKIVSNDFVSEFKKALQEKTDRVYS
ncbi:Stf0 family sulfotransferase [Cytobacillus pseudoceanisediminis]|uniref:Stf0 family sulfotransferase n=1 Tax=Cytobacillus pseudoceanisediminis TaxID=3051614 RepID=UPI003C2C7EBB